MGENTFQLIIEGQVMRETSIYVSDINEGLWLSENDEELIQTYGLTKNCFFG